MTDETDNSDTAADSHDASDFDKLDPNCILDAIDSVGYISDGRINALNSYENRVYQIGIEDSPPVVAKFYRPARWSDECIAEEHAFTLELQARDIPVICAQQSQPVEVQPGSNKSQAGEEPDYRAQARELLYSYANYRFSIYPRAGGRPPELDNPEQLEVIGRAMGRLHSVGELSTFSHRPKLDPGRLGDESKELILAGEFLPVHMRDVYRGLVEDIMQVVHQRFAEAASIETIRIHGDFHPGNILWGRDDTPHLLDFDDCCMGPAVQDLWMFLSGDQSYRTARVADLLEGYTQFREFDPRELQLIEPLRCLRQIHYAAWIARRWTDPAFVKAFPFFAEERYWDEHVLSLREQRAALDEPTIRWD